MATIGDVVQLFFKTLGEGAGHNYAVATRGGDYRLKEEAADARNRAGAMEQAQLETKLTNERDALLAAAEFARSRGFAGRGAAGPVATAAASDAEAARQLEAKRVEADIGLKGAQTEAARNAPTAAELEAQRQAGRRELEDIRSENRRDLEGLRGELRASLQRPRYRILTDEQGQYQLDLDTGERTRLGSQAPTAEMRNREAAKKNIVGVLDLMETYSDKINTLKPGISTIAGTARGAAAWAGFDNDVRLYQDAVTGFIPMLARSVGHVGILTQQDVDSVKALLPTPRDNAELAAQKWRDIRGILTRAQVLGGEPSAAADGLSGVVSDLPGGGWNPPPTGAPAATPDDRKSAILKKYGY